MKKADITASKSSSVEKEAWACRLSPSTRHSVPADATASAMSTS